MKFSTILPIETLSGHSLPVAEAYCLAAPRSLAKRLTAEILDGTERARLQKFRRMADAERFMVAHNLKRSFLGMLLGHNPADIGFAFGRGNKPLLAGGQCHFNLSHSGNRVALMVSRRAPVGIVSNSRRPTGPTCRKRSSSIPMTVCISRLKTTAIVFMRAGH